MIGTLRPLYWLNATAAMWPGAPSWAVAKDHLSGAAFAAATISATVFWPAVGDDVNERGLAAKCDRREIGHRIVGRVLQHQSRDVMGRSVKQHRVAVWRRALDIKTANRGVTTGTVLDDELHVVLGLGLGGNQARKGVDAAARRHRHHDADRTGGEVGLRAQHAGRCDNAKKRNNGVTAIDAARHEMCPEWLPCPLVALRASSMEL